MSEGGGEASVRVMSGIAVVEGESIHLLVCVCFVGFFFGGKGEAE